MKPVLKLLLVLAIAHLLAFVGFIAYAIVSAVFQLSASFQM